MRIVLFILALLSPTKSWASEFMSVKGAAEIPVGYDQLCKQHSKACQQDGREPQRITLTLQRTHFLQDLNHWINQLIVPTTDPKKHHGEVEKWELLNCLNGGDCRGDCEEYVLLKRQFLIEAGWPASALLITVVYDEKNEGHAILTVATNIGDYILDNKTSEIHRWDKTPYKFVARQSIRDPTIWHSIVRKNHTASVTTSGWGPARVKKSR